MSNIYQVMSTVWKWQWEYVLQIQYFNVAGSIIGIVFSFFMVKNKIDFRKIFFLGFVLLAMSMLWFSHLFYPDTKVEAIAPTLMLEGIAQGVIFTPLVLYITGSVHPSITGSAAQAGTAIRFWTTTIGFSLMQNAILYLTTKHQFLMTKNLDKTSPIFQQQWNNLFNKNIASHLPKEAESITAAALKAKLYNQALLVSNIEIFRTLFVVGIIAAIFVIYIVKIIFIYYFLFN